ncbi:hypothetical protein BGW41_002268 [Actinomortierella wolfii]|nr:hypothetical protein BGW41_002268 [Actinomortierella wolfii]
MHGLFLIWKVGGGLGGLMLGALLEKAGISYVILERAKEAKPLGSAISVSICIAPVYKQLGVYDELVQNSQPFLRVKTVSHPPSKEQVTDFVDRVERYGDNNYVIPRAKLHAIMSKLIPKEKLLYGKKVTGVQQNDEGALVICNGNEIIHGDVVIGADGTYSSVRTALYKQLKAKGILPKEDDSHPPFSTLCMVGVTKPLPPGLYDIGKDQCRAENMLYEGLPYASLLIAFADRTVAWLVVQHAGRVATRDEERFKNSEWAVGGVDELMSKVSHLPTAFGPPLKFFFDNTPKDTVSKIMLEEKIYTTWYHGRVAMLGDAVHKVHPAAGQGAVNAMMDAVVLANVFDACRSTKLDDLRRCFEAYYDERFLPAKSAFIISHRVSSFLKKSFISDMARTIAGLMPRSVQIAQLDKRYLLRPQAAFLPQIPHKGLSPPLPQRSYDHLRTSSSKESEETVVSLAVN